MISPVSTTAALPPQSPPASRPGPAARAADDAPEQAERDQAGEATAESAAPQQSPDGLSPEERRIVAELQRTDQQVRAHEQAHLAAAGGLARGVSFSFVTGPDGQQYAVGGEVSIDTSPVAGSPEATIRKAQQIRAAANAPANPSGQDRAVAAAASQMEVAARQELAEQQRQQLAQQAHVSQAREFEQPRTSDIGNVLSLLA